MTDHSTWRRLARWGLLGVCALGIGVSLPTVDWVEAVSLLPAGVYAAIGLLVSMRRPANAVGWLFLGVGAVAGLIGATMALMQLGIRRGTPDVWYALASAWAANFLWAVALSLGFALTLLLFPHGLVGPRWRPVLWVTVATTIAIVVVAALAPTLVVGTYEYPNPLHPGGWATALNGTWVVLLGLLSVCFALALLSSVVRFVRARGVERAQMRWLAYSGAILLVFAFTPRLNSSDIAFAVVFSLVPASCGVAILRYHLYDIDRIISRTTSYAIVTGLVVATYALVVTTASWLLPDSSTVAVATATLAAAALARPLLRRVQVVVDRRFNRSQYDALRTVDEFGGRLRHQVDPDAVVADLAQVVREALQPTRAEITILERR